MSEEAQTTVAEIGAADAVVVPTPSIEGDMGGSENGSTEMSDEPIAVEVDGRVVKLLAVGQQIIGTVKRVTEFGAFVDIGVGRDGLVHISELSVRRVGKVADVLKEGQEITVWIKKLDRDRNRISLSMIEPGTKKLSRAASPAFSLMGPLSTLASVAMPCSTSAR
jgi:uncharacterized protein